MLPDIILRNYDKICEKLKYSDMRTKMVAVVFNKNKIFNIAENYRRAEFSVHAEMNAIRRLLYQECNDMYY
jgi:tRNA(Arg) A34 adenosine deaminase TadA